MTGWMDWIGAVVALLGAGMLVSSAIQIARALACRRWPRAAGEVLSSEVRLMSGGSTSASGLVSGRASYLPVVRYRYEWCGRRHECDWRTYGDYAGPHERAQAIVARYPPGQRVTVHVHPGRPERAVLETQLRWGLLLLPLIGLVFLVGGAVMITL